MLREVTRSRTDASATAGEAIQSTIDVRTIAPHERHALIFSSRGSILVDAATLQVRSDSFPTRGIAGRRNLSAAVFRRTNADR